MNIEIVQFDVANSLAELAGKCLDYIQALDDYKTSFGNDIIRKQRVNHAAAELASMFTIVTIETKDSDE